MLIHLAGCYLLLNDSLPKVTNCDELHVKFAFDCLFLLLAQHSMTYLSYCVSLDKKKTSAVQNAFPVCHFSTFVYKKVRTESGEKK